MTTTDPTTTSTSPLPGSDVQTGALRRFGSLVWAETRILFRNRTAAFTALAIPFLLGVLFVGIGLPSGGLGQLLATVLLGNGLLFVIYYTMVTSLVGRREQLVLKRLITGEPTKLEVLLAPAVPLWGILAVQTLIGVVFSVLALGATLAHPWALVLAVVLGSAAWTALAIWGATWTRTVESAQLTTLPFMLVALFLSGFSVPLSALPGPVERLAHWLPLTPVVDLMTLGFTGLGADQTPVDGAAAFGAAFGMILPLVLWTLLGLSAGLRAFRWDARS